MDWQPSVFRITGPDPTAEPRGTGFAAHRAGDTLFIVTCRHVVDAIRSRDLDIHIGRYRCTLVSSPGDENLDLAVLAVPLGSVGDDAVGQALRSAKTLALGDQARRGLDVRIYGYGPEGRLLQGHLGGPLRWPHVSGEDVDYWDYYLDTREAAAEFERIKDGYSGSPALDPEAERVVAVITHRVGGDKGHAIDIGALPRVYPPADAWFQPIPDPEPDHEYAGEPDEPLAKVLDHLDQLNDIHRAFRDGGRDRQVVLIDAADQSDWPEYLADHIHLDPWPDDHRNARRHEPLLIDPRDDDGFWQALVRATPRGADAADRDAQREQVRRWVNEQGLLVLYAPIIIERHGARLARLLESAQEAIEKLGPFTRQRARLLVLFVCMPEGARAPFWWSWLNRFKLGRLDGVVRPPPLRLITRADVQLWHDNFPKRLCDHYNPGDLKSQLSRLFDGNRDQVRYGEVRDCLIGDPSGTGALARARRRRR